MAAEDDSAASQQRLNQLLDLETELMELEPLMDDDDVRTINRLQRSAEDARRNGHVQQYNVFWGQIQELLEPYRIQLEQQPQQPAQVYDFADYDSEDEYTDSYEGETNGESFEEYEDFEDDDDDQYRVAHAAGRKSSRCPSCGACLHCGNMRR